MAFRHWQGTPPRTTGMWKCPTCGSEQTGPLEAGCTVCKAGADAKAAQQLQAALQPIRRVTGRSPFEQWAEQQYPKGLDTAGWSVASAAWDAGYSAGYDAAKLAHGPVWDDPTTDPEARTVKQGELVMITATSQEPLDERTRGTLLAALAFYRDNQLSYGPIPGQLSAQEVTELITKLSPAEEPEA